MTEYKTKDGSIMKVEHFKSLNYGKKLTKSQENLLGITKIKINKQKGK